MAWSIGHTRLLYVNVVPAAKKMEYLALFYAVIEMIRFTGPLASGLLLDYLQGGDTMPADLGTGGPYQTYFTLTMVLLGLSVVPLMKIRSAPVDPE